MNILDEPLMKPSPLKGLLSYIIIYLGISSIIMILVAVIIGLTNGTYDLSTIIALISTTEDNVSESLKPAYYTLNTYTNFLTYLFSFGIVGFFMRDSIYEDFTSVKNRKLFHILFAIISAFLFWIVSIVISNVMSNIVGESNNQNMIVSMIQNNGAVPIFFTVVVFAPFVEELVYRKCIFKLLEKKNIIISYLVSTIVFVLPHMISTPMNDFVKWSLLCVPYVVSAILLCLIYHKSNKNLYVVWFVHMINNLISFLIIVLGVM